MRKPVSHIVISAIVAFLALSILNSYAQNAKGSRELEVHVVMADGRELFLYKDYYALVGGVGEYDHWTDLRRPIKDAEEVAVILEKLGMKVNLLKNPTSAQLKRALNYLAYQGGIKKDRAILFFFTGHGETETLVTSEKLGYIVPRDCPRLDQDRDGFIDKAVSMKTIETYAYKIRSKHVLMVFDSCFSGALFPSSKGIPLNISEKSIRAVRQFITAGNEEEQVPDDSIFKTCFVQGINGEADLNNDGYVTGSELGMYLENKVVNQSGGNQHPQAGKIRHPQLNKGDFIFALPSVPSRRRKMGPAQVVPVIPEYEVGPGQAKADEVAVAKPELTGSGGLYITAEPEGVNIQITIPSGKRFDGGNRSRIGLKELPPGRYLAQLSKPLYHSHEVPVDVTTGISKRHIALKPNFGWLTVTSEPPDALVYIDGRYQDRTPLPEKKKKSGVYIVRVSLPRYHDFEKQVIISDEKKSKVEVKLDPAFGTLIIDSRPDKAEVWLDGERAGQTPYQKEHSSGSYLLSLRKKLYDSVLDQKITIQDGQKTKKRYRLTPNFGTVNVNSTPPGAAIYVDGRRVGQTPLAALKLNPGKYDLKVGGDESLWVTKGFKVTMVREAEIPIDAVLERKKGGLNVYTVPDVGTVEVLLEGEENRRFGVPDTVKGLPTGEYTLKCRLKQDGRDLVGSQTVTVKWGKIEDVTITLQPEPSKNKLDPRTAVKVAMKDFRNRDYASSLNHFETVYSSQIDKLKLSGRRRIGGFLSILTKHRAEVLFLLELDRLKSKTDNDEELIKEGLQELYDQIDNGGGVWSIIPESKRRKIKRHIEKF